VETLLHEMIHALLFVTERNTDHDGHGPNFCAHMKRINGITGANISTYHTFHQEVVVCLYSWTLKFANVFFTKCFLSKFFLYSIYYSEYMLSPFLIS
jgi:hypothetical protein